MEIHNLLVEEEKRFLKEIGEGNASPFKWDNKFFSFSKNHHAAFFAPIGNEIKKEELPRIFVNFENIDYLEYNISFTVNDNGMQAFKSNMSYYLKIIATVFEIIKKFIDEYPVKILHIKGQDKTNVILPGQKNRIYFSYIEKNAEKLGFRYSHENNGIVLIKI